MKFTAPIARDIKKIGHFCSVNYFMNSNGCSRITNNIRVYLFTKTNKHTDFEQKKYVAELTDEFKVAITTVPSIVELLLLGKLSI